MKKNFLALLLVCCLVLSLNYLLINCAAVCNTIYLNKDAEKLIELKANKKPVLTGYAINYTTNRLTWSEIDGAASYIIYLLNEDTNKYEKYGEINGTTCYDKNLLPNTKYTYRVRVKFSDGSMGKMSNELSVFTFNKYGNNPINRGDIALQGEWIYQYQDKKIYKTNIFTKEREIITNADCVYNLNVIGDSLYYMDDYSIYKIGINGKKSEILFDSETSQYDIELIDMIVISNRIYIQVSETKYDEQPTTYGIQIIDTDGNYLNYINSPCIYSKCSFINSDRFEICLGGNEKMQIFDDNEDWSIIATNNYNITQIQADLKVKNLSINNLGEVVYYGKNILYIGENGKLYCYDINTKKKFAISKNKVVKVFSKNNTLYYITERNQLIKYENSEKYILSSNLSDVYFFENYIIYFDANGNLTIIDYDGKQLSLINNKFIN